jgi:hypothetical protein
MTPIDDFLHLAGTCSADAFHGTRVDGFHRFRKQFGDHTEVVNEKCHDAGKRTKPDGHDKQQREHDFVDGPASVHQPPHRLNDPLRTDVG